MQFCPDFAVLWQSVLMAGKIAAISISAMKSATQWDCRNTPDFGSLLVYCRNTIFAQPPPLLMSG